MDSSIFNKNNFQNLTQAEKDRNLLQAVKHGYTAMVRDLINAGANIEAIDPASGDTPLMAAAYSDNVIAVSLLLKAGANPDVADYLFGNTALMLAILKDNLVIANILIEAKAKLDIENVFNQTALACAFARNNTALIRCLFSVMSVQQLHKEISLQPKLQSLFDEFSQTVKDHRMTIFKKVGPLALDINEKNPFLNLPIEVMGLIISNYFKLTNNESWQIHRSGLDAHKACMAIAKNGPLTFSASAPNKKDNKISHNFIETKFCNMLKSLKIKSKK